MSNKMLNASSAKIRLAPKAVLLFSIVAIVFTVCATAYLLAQKKSSESHANTLAINTTNVKVEIADTPAERAQGLSDRNSLAKNTAMLFIFPEASEQCMWMKDMKFSLDIVWINSSKKVLKIAEGLSPDTYPQAFCADNTNYVLEFNQGVVQKTGLKIGQTIPF